MFGAVPATFPTAFLIYVLGYLFYERNGSWFIYMLLLSSPAIAGTVGLWIAGITSRSLSQQHTIAKFIAGGVVIDGVIVTRFLCNSPTALFDFHYSTLIGPVSYLLGSPIFFVAPFITAIVYEVAYLRSRRAACVAGRS